MSEIDNINILKDTLRRISMESVLSESEALDVIIDGMIYPEWIEFFAPKIIEFANKGNTVVLIKIEVYSLMAQISVVGGLENYKRLKGLA